jgi:hypothetical protein
MNIDEFIAAGHEISICANNDTRRFEYKIKANGKIKEFSSKTNTLDIQELEAIYHDQTGLNLFD